MKNLLLSILLSITFSSVVPAPNTDAIASPEDVVYICTGRTATKYHASKSCRGLRNCQGDIKAVTRSDAERKYSRTPCKICKP